MIFSKIKTRMKEAFKVSGYSHTVKELNKLSDSQLMDIGISRELLKLGVKAYPWREETVSQAIPNNLTHLNTAKVVIHTPIMPKTPKAA